MAGTSCGSRVPRRSFLSRLGAGLSVAGATLAARPATASAQSPASSPWQPARHPQDDWLEQVPGKHRLVFDTTNQDGFGSALRYANNYIYANQFGYNLTDADVAVVIIARHDSMQFALTDKMWAKYGAPLSPKGGADTTPKSGAARNRFNNPETAENGVTLDALVKHGVHFAVCQMAARRMAGIIATDTKTGADAVYNELAANIIQNSHMVPAGIVTVNRAQERGYALAIGG
jgi:intracellular sulfur oxidation DsrE/DsrF family protein